MILSAAEARAAGSGRRGMATLKVIGIITALSLLTLSIEHWRGKALLSKWKRIAQTKGDVFEPGTTWPKLTFAALRFSNQLAQTVSEIPPELFQFGGTMKGRIVEGHDVLTRGSQQERPHPDKEPSGLNSWGRLHELAVEAAPALRTLREILENPPGGPGYDIRKLQGMEPLPNFVNVRRCGQLLVAVTLDSLHQKDLHGAQENLRALFGLTRLYEEDSCLVTYMIRVALLGLCYDAAWDALQEEGWTEAELASLHSVCADGAKFVHQMAPVMETERMVRLGQLNWFAHHDYEAWLARYRAYAELIGHNPATNSLAKLTTQWRQHLFHPVWQFAWADLEALEYLQHTQPDVAALKEFRQTQSWTLLNSRLSQSYEEYQAPSAAWRFYMRLPIVEGLSAIIGPPVLNVLKYPYPEYSRAWSITSKNITQNELLMTAVALRRYELAFGSPAPGLKVLVPAYLRRPPTDFMCGRPLSYRADGNGAFLVYARPDNSPEGSNRHAPGTFGDLQWRQAPTVH